MSMVEQIATVNADFKRCFEDIYEAKDGFKYLKQDYKLF